MWLGAGSLRVFLKITLLLALCAVSVQAADASVNNESNSGTSSITNCENAPSAVSSRRSSFAASPQLRETERIPFMVREETATTAEVPSAAGMLARTMGALLLILGFIIVASFVLRRIGGSWFSPPPEEGGELSVLAAISLGDKRTLTAVRFGEQLLLIGSTAQSMTLLATQDRLPQKTPPPPRSVAELLREPEPLAFEQALTRAEKRVTRPLIPQEPTHQK
jgi:flagellar biogenesis protein FliO